MKESIEKLHDYDICLETRTITFFEEINSETASKFIKNLHLLDNEKNGTITVLLTTEGGDVSAGLKMVDAIRLCKNYVRCICYDGVESMGTVVLQAFDDRFMSQNSYLMLHEGDASVEGKYKDRAEWNRLLDYQEGVCLDIYLDKINNRQREKKKKLIKKNELKSTLEFDKILLPQEAIAMGLADSIVKESY